MFPLIETIIGFVVIMLVLSLLVKSLTSVVKNHFDYYSSNFKSEVERLLRGTIKGGWDKWKEKAPWLDEVQWHRLREDFLTEKNMEWLLEKLDVEPKALKNLEARLEVHKANIRFAFEKRTKNLSLAMGLALCLFMNINAFAIWQTLYGDQQARAKFSSPEYVESALERMAEYDQKIAALTTVSGGSDAGEKEELEKEREALEKQIYHLQGEVGFGIAKIWTGEVTKWCGFLYEFFGSLLTGILVSIGAPYWHDLLKALTALRGLKKPEKAPSAAG